jgi:hypothetical protein
VHRPLCFAVRADRNEFSSSVQAKQLRDGLCDLDAAGTNAAWVSRMIVSAKHIGPGGPKHELHDRA